MSDFADVRTVRATFELVDRTEEVLDEAGPGPRLSRVTIRKRYSGPLVGRGLAQVLLAAGEDGSGYVACERVVGRFEGREGTFVVQHSGVADGDALSASGVVVPHSGTGGFTGLRGRAYEAEMGVLTLELEAEADR